MSDIERLSELADAFASAFNVSTKDSFWLLATIGIALNRGIPSSEILSDGVRRGLMTKRASKDVTKRTEIEDDLGIENIRIEAVETGIFISQGNDIVYIRSALFDRFKAVINDSVFSGGLAK